MIPLSYELYFSQSSPKPLITYTILNCTAVNAFKTLQALVRAVRNTRAEYSVEPGKKIAATVRISQSSAVYIKELNELLKMEGKLLCVPVYVCVYCLVLLPHEY